MLLLLVLLLFYTLKFDSALLILEMQTSLFVLLNILFAIGDVKATVLTPFFACHFYYKLMIPYSLYFNFICIKESLQFKMRNKNISFAEVLKRKNKLNSINNTKPKLKLSDYLEEWQQNPDEAYILYFDQSKIRNDRSMHQISVVSKAQSNEELFDSWIQKQGYVGNKENMAIQPNRYDRNEKNVFPKKTVVTQRNRYVKDNMQKGNQMRFSQIKNQNSSRNNPLEIDINISRQLNKNSCLVNRSKSPMSYKHNESSLLAQEDSRDIRYQKKDVASFKFPGDPISSEINEVRAVKKMDQKANQKLVTQLSISKESVRQNELQQIINATDNIHIEIAQLAHQYVLQQKKKSEQQQLLISVEPKKQPSKQFRENPQLQKMQQANGENKMDQNLREQVKKQVGNLLKTFNTKKSVPNFGPTAASIKQPVRKPNQSKNYEPINMIDNKSINTGHVGYSFSTNLLNQIQSEMPQIPLLSIPEEPSPTIPHIAEIQSERHASESNEQIYDIYQKWKRENIPYEKDCDDVHKIASVHYQEQEADIIQEQYQNTVPNQPKQLHCLINNTFGKNIAELNGQVLVERQLPQIKPVQQKYSNYIPEIVVQIPKNYQEINYKQGEMNDYAEYENKYGQHQSQRKQVLCLSASPPQYSPQLQKVMTYQTTPQQLEIQLQPNATSQKKIMMQSKKSEKSQQRFEEQVNQPGTSRIVTPSREIYLSQNQDQQITTNFEEQIVPAQEPYSNQQPIEDIQKADSCQKMSLQELRQQKQQTKQIQPKTIITKPQKQSPKQFNNFCLNKVYSSPKENNSNPNPQKQTIPVSDFAPETKIQKQQSPKSIPFVAMKYEGGKYQFAHNSEEQNIEGGVSKAKQYEKQTFDKKYFLEKPPALSEKNTHKIESYAYPISTNQLNLLRPQVKQTIVEQKQQFDFDF